MPANSLFPPLPKNLPHLDYAFLSSLSCRDDSSDLSDPPDFPTFSKTAKPLGHTPNGVKRKRTQGPTPSSSQSNKHQSLSCEVASETLTLPPPAIDALCKTINESFPWTTFAAEHNLDPTTLRTHINTQILFPILSSSLSHLEELSNRAENYRIVRSAIAQHLTDRELDEARDLREYEK
ncbi:MAG: hypothetical protein Q9218_008113, partial [Villophora microphyllina]